MFKDEIKEGRKKPLSKRNNKSIKRTLIRSFPFFSKPGQRYFHSSILSSVLPTGSTNSGELLANPTAGYLQSLKRCHQHDRLHPVFRHPRVFTFFGLSVIQPQV
jgi:hypothetical protein